MVGSSHCELFLSDRLLGMRDYQQGLSVFQNTLLNAMERLWIKGGKTLVQDEDGSPLQQRAGYIEPTALTMRQLPAGLTDDLPQPGRHHSAQPSKLGARTSVRASGSGEAAPGQNTFFSNDSGSLNWYCHAPRPVAS